jgi:hypothetical protein
MADQHAADWDLRRDASAGSGDGKLNVVVVGHHFTWE